VKKIQSISWSPSEINQEGDSKEVLVREAEGRR
jgi:hypothetical protein